MSFLPMNLMLTCETFDSNFIIQHREKTQEVRKKFRPI